MTVRHVMFLVAMLGSVVGFVSSHRCARAASRFRKDGRRITRFGDELAFSAGEIFDPHNYTREGQPLVVRLWIATFVTWIGALAALALAFVS